MKAIETIIQFLEVVIWPLVVIGIILLFRRSIKLLIDRIKSVELPGGTKLELEKKIEEEVHKLKLSVSEKVDDLMDQKEMQQRAELKTDGDYAKEVVKIQPELTLIHPPREGIGLSRMLVFATGDSIETNLDCNLYFNPADRNHNRQFAYIGLYVKQNISHVGKVSKIAYCDYDENTKQLISTNGYDVNALTESEKERIRIAMMESVYKKSIQRNHKFILVDKFHKTTYKKSSSYGLQANKYFWLPDIDGFKENMSAQELAELLQNKEWE
jgi:hypothetical protein